jgi:hypothetical protein
MSVEQIEQTLLNLSREERRRFAQWFYDHEEQLLDETDSVLVGAWRQEVRQRIAEIESGTVNGVPGDEVSAKIRQIVGR